MQKKDVKNRKQSLNSKFLGIGFSLLSCLSAWSAPVPNGSFEIATGHLVYHLDGNVCTIQNSEQLSYFGGSQNLRKALPSEWIDYLNHLSLESTSCPWPDGFFKVQNRSEIFRLYEDWNYCSIVSDTQLKEYGDTSIVQILTDVSSNLGAYRYYSGPCD